MNKYIKKDFVIKILDDLAEDYVDSIQELVVEEKQNGFNYRDRITIECFDSFIERLQYLRNLVNLEASLHGKKEN